MDALASIHPVPAGWLRNSDLAGFVPAYRQHLVDRRYADQTQRAYLCCVAHFARWITRRRLTVCDLAEDDVRRFLDEHLPRCSCPLPVQRCRHQVRAALRHLLASLRDAGFLVEHPIASAVEDELRRFDEHMQRARGLAANTRAQRLRILRSFLVERAGSGPAKLAALGVDDLRRFIEQQLQRWSPASAHVLASTLRGYIRFRAVCGDSVAHLLPVIVSPAHWRLAPLPETLSPTEVTRLLGAFSSEGPSALRAYAMVRCVADLGLRASEVVGLNLDDIDWRAGTIRIGPNKSRRVDVLPLPQATGSAIARYLHSERPRTANRRVFVRHVAPVDEPIGPGVVRRAVCAAYRRCGLTHTRVHVLRHTLAGRLLEGGATLKEVADVLRHRQLDTSLIYAKVDIDRLSAVALPWPGRRA
jgi:site-specific recombinase XerD